MSCTFVFPLWLAEMVSQRICTILGILRLSLGQGPSSLVEDKHKWTRDIVLYCELGVARSGWVTFYPLFEPQSPFCRTCDTVGFAHGRNQGCSCQSSLHWHLEVLKPTGFGGWDRLLCHLVPVPLMLTTLFFHQHSALTVHFLLFAASFSALSPFLQQQGSHSATTAEVTKRHSSSWKLKSLQ